MESVSGDSFGCFVGDEFDGLYDTLDNLLRVSIPFCEYRCERSNSLRVRYQSILLPCSPGSTPTASQIPKMRYRYPSSEHSELPLVLTVLTLSYAVLYPFIDTHGLTLANRLKVLLNVKLSETWPFPIGVASGPLSATVFFLMESMAF